MPSLNVIDWSLEQIGAERDDLRARGRQPVLELRFLSTAEVEQRRREDAELAHRKHLRQQRLRSVRND
jgi:hypothetical protein